MAINISTWLCGPPPAKGQMQRYPSRFLYNVKKNYPELMDNDVLHMFSGSCEFGVCTDSRMATGADIVCDFRDLPFIMDGSKFSGVLADPPYADQYQNEWGGDLPKPKHILGVASRLVNQGGLIGVLHIICIPAYKCFGVERIGLHPILCGPNNAMRVFNVFKKI